MGNAIIYITAQPDEIYFIWQLRLQLCNFKELGIPKSDVHVLIGLKVGAIARQSTTEFCQDFRESASFYFYNYELNPRNSYKSIVRPQLLRQHFESNPVLENASVFYCDSDILLKKRICQSLGDGKTIFVSDTSNYLDSSYFIGKTNYDFFLYITSLVGVDPQLVIANDKNCGGAQYILKNINHSFWKDVEVDSQLIFDELNKFNNNEADRMGVLRSEHKGIQSWCADMWSIFWNLLKLNHQILISDLLNFCWANGDENCLSSASIIHYTGEQKDKNIFKKTEFLKYDPFYNLFGELKQYHYCSRIVIEYVQRARSNLMLNRIELSAVSFLMPVRIDSESRLENLIATLCYLSKFFKTEIIIIESDITPRIPKELIENLGVRYIFQYDEGVFMRAKINNKLIEASQRRIIAIYDIDVIFPVSQLINAVNCIEKETYDACFPFDGKFVDVDPLHKKMFLKVLSSDIFETNQFFFDIAGERSVGGCIFIDRKKYIESGGENLNIPTWGPDDKERVKRMEILGYKIGRVKGVLYHLPHDRKYSGYLDKSLEISYRKEYVKISRMDEKSLRSYLLNSSAFELKP